jgi:hypothetical protein
LLTRRKSTNNQKTANDAKTKKGKREPPLFIQFGAGKESRTLDLNLGKVALYQLSYSRIDEIIAEKYAPAQL